MDTFLANYFGTNQGAPELPNETDDLEKMAQLVMLDRLAADKEVDLSDLSDEDYVKLAAQVFNREQAPAAPAEEPVAEAPEADEHEKVAMARVEEAKFLGQVVAHSMWNELDSIQKHAYDSTAAAKDVTDKMPGAMSDAGLSARIHGKAAKKAVGDAASKAWQGLKKHKGKAAIIGGGTLAAAAGAKALHGKMKDKDEPEDEGKDKEGSAFDTLSDARAYEILQSYGLADDQGNVVTPEQLQKHAEEQAVEPEKTAADKLAEAVELDAWEKLAALGYPVNQGQ